MMKIPAPRQLRLEDSTRYCSAMTESICPYYQWQTESLSRGRGRFEVRGNQLDRSRHFTTVWDEVQALDAIALRQQILTRATGIVETEKPVSYLHYSITFGCTKICDQVHTCIRGMADQPGQYGSAHAKTDDAARSREQFEVPISLMHLHQDNTNYAVAPKA